MAKTMIQTISLFEHLTPETARCVLLPLAERIKLCQTDRWIGYTRAQQILRQIDDLISYPKSLQIPNLLLVGPSDSGKSSIIQRFVQRHHMVIGEVGSPGPCIIHLAMPAKPTESSFWSELLWALNIGHRINNASEKKRRQAYDAMEYASVRLLVIEEFHHLANAGKKSAKLLAEIKNVSAALSISILASGTQAAANAIHSDSQLRSRFELAVLDRWNLDREYLRFLVSYERLLPLAEPSNLASREIAPVIYGMAGDMIGGTVKLLKYAAAHALRIGRERIDLDVLCAQHYITAGGWDEVEQRV